MEVTCVVVVYKYLGACAKGGKARTERCGGRFQVFLSLMNAQMLPGKPVGGEIIHLFSAWTNFHGADFENATYTNTSISTRAHTPSSMRALLVNSSTLTRRSRISMIGSNYR